MGRIYINEKQLILKKMIEIYRPTSTDWMSYIITKKNFLTYHHIKPEKEGGKISIENGALLTKNAHRDLNRIEEFDYALYQDWNELFWFILNSQAPIDEYYKIEAQKLKMHTKKLLYKK